MMKSNMEKQRNQNLVNKYSFFKKEDMKVSLRKLRLERLRIGAFLSLVLWFQVTGMMNYHASSKDFQSQAVPTFKFTPTAPIAKGSLNNFMYEYLNKSFLNYDEMNSLLNTMKNQSKEIPSYVFMHFIDKIKISNDFLYDNGIKTSRQELFRIENSGLIDAMFDSTVEQKNHIAFEQKKKTLQENHDLIETKLTEITKSVAYSSVK